MNNIEIIQHIKTEYKDVKGIRAGTMREKKKYVCCVMGNIPSHKDDSSIAKINFLNISFNSEFSAKKLADLINKTFK